MKKITENIIMIVICITMFLGAVVTIKSIKDNKLEKEDNIVNRDNEFVERGNSKEINKDKREHREINDDEKNLPMEKPKDNPVGDITEDKTATNEEQAIPFDEFFKDSKTIEEPKTSIKTPTYLYILLGSEIVMFSLSAIYLAMSKVNNLTLKETFSNTDKKLIYTISVILVSIVLLVITSYFI